MASKQIMISTLPRKITIAISFSTKPARIDFCFDMSKGEIDSVLLTQRCSEEGPHIPLINEKREGASKSQEHANGDFPFSLHFPQTQHTDTIMDHQTPSTDTTQHPENAAKPASMGRGKRPAPVLAKDSFREKETCG